MLYFFACETFQTPEMARGMEAAEISLVAGKVSYVGLVMMTHAQGLSNPLSAWCFERRFVQAICSL
jgi:hypothetical protein